MQAGRKLKVGKVEFDLAEFQEMFDLHGTLCEAPECAADPRPAHTPYQTERAFAFLCRIHHEYVESLSFYMKQQWDMRLTEHMMAVMRRHSFVHTNMESGFRLEEAVRARTEVLREIKKEAGKQEAADRRDLRRQIRESPVKIGQADEQLLTARARQEGRIASGGKPVGPKPADRVGLLVPLLVIGESATQKE